MKRSRELADAPDREQDARHERAAVDRVVADRERLALAAEDDLLVRDEPGQPHRVDRLVHVAAGLGDQLGRALGGARRGVELAVVVELDDLDLGHVLGAIRLRRVHHQHGADREVGRHEHVGAVRAGALDLDAQGVEVEAGRADDGVDAGGRRPRGRSRAPSSGVVKSTTTSASSRTSPSVDVERGSARPASSRSSAPSTASQTVAPMRPAAPDTATLITPPPARRAHRLRPRCGSSPRRRRCRRPTAAPGRRARGASSATSSALTASTRASISSSESSGRSMQDRPRAARHSRRGRLEPEDDAALDVLLRAVELVGRRRRRRGGDRARGR